MVGTGRPSSPAIRPGGTPEVTTDRDGGLFRAFLAGPGRTLMDAFASLNGAPGVHMLVRHPQRHLVGARMAVRPEEGDGLWEFTQVGNDIYVVVGNFAYKTPRVEFVPGDGLIQFYFKLSGDLTVAVSQTEPLRLNRPSLLVYFQPLGIDFKEWTAPGSRERFIAINIRAEYLADHFLSSTFDVPPQLRALVSGSPEEFRYRQLPLNSRMFELASRLVDNPYTGSLALIHTEATTLELLCAAVAEFSAAQQISLEPYSEHDLRCLHSARALVMNQLSPALTIRQIARAAGMNETSLKRGFKALFGETVFDFSVRCRMQHALTLLRERRIPVAQVAEAVGYSHQTSFATAFRRHFGLSPKDARGLKAR
jgi:AraC-like DNA-binding protein